MKHIDKVIKYTDRIWTSIQRNKSEYAHAQTYGEATELYIRPAFTKRGILRNKILGIWHILNNDFRQDMQYYMPRVFCIVQIDKYRCKTFTKFLRRIMPMLAEPESKDMEAVTEVAREVYDVNLVVGGKFNAVHN